MNLSQGVLKVSKGIVGVSKGIVGVSEGIVGVSEGISGLSIPAPFFGAIFGRWGDYQCYLFLGNGVLEGFCFKFTVEILVY
jgi:hypothetical protein